MRPGLAGAWQFVAILITRVAVMSAVIMPVTLPIDVILTIMSAFISVVITVIAVIASVRCGVTSLVLPVVFFVNQAGNYYTAKHTNGDIAAVRCAYRCD